LVIASPSGVTGTCSGASTAVVVVSSGGTSIGFSATLNPSTSCTFSVNLVAPNTDVIINNTTGPVASSAGAGAAGTATLSVARPPTVSKSFVNSDFSPVVSIGEGDTITIAFIVNNPNGTVTLNNISFTDTLPAGLVVATPNGVTGACGGGAVTAVAGSTSISLAGATLTPGSSCSIRVNVTATGAALNLLTNPSFAITSNQSPAGASAPVSIFIGTPFQVSYFSNVNLADSVINVTNTGARGAGLASGTSAATTGALCLNAYAFSPDEQMIACCSCPVTPNGLVSLSVKNDLVSNTLTPAVPNSVVVKLLATVPVGGSCTNSAAAAALANLSPGLAAWGTKIHGLGTGAAMTETPFGGAILSNGELSRLTNLCNFIIGNGSGFGICRSCRLGGLGAVAQ
jgi:uncharacterized repeat protein (TIGR01451 family)